MDTTLIQVRNVPRELHDELQRRAKLRHQSLSGFLLSLLEREVATPSVDDVVARIEALPKERVDVVQLIHEMREERDAELEARVTRR